MDIKQLLSKEQNLQEQEYILSLYVPIEEAEHLKHHTQIKSLAQSALHANGINFQREQNKDDFYQYLISLFPVQGYLPAGIVVFLILDNSGEDLKITETITENLLITPEATSEFGKYFNLKQLFDSEQYSANALVVRMEEQESKIWSLQGEAWQEQGVVSNDYDVTPKPQYASTHQPTTSQSSQHGAGYDKYQRDKQKANEMYVSKIADHLEGSSADALLIYASAKIYDLIENRYPQEEAFKQKPIFKIIKKELTDKQLQHEAVTNLHELIAAQHQQEIESIPDNIEKYAQGWRQVVEAINMSRVDKLFTNLNSRKGFVSADNLSYLEESELATDDLLRWVLRGAINTGAEVAVVKDLESDVVARLRY